MKSSIKIIITVIILAVMSWIFAKLGSVEINDIMAKWYQAASIVSAFLIALVLFFGSIFGCWEDNR